VHWPGGSLGNKQHSWLHNGDMHVHVCWYTSDHWSIVWHIYLVHHFAYDMGFRFTDFCLLLDVNSTEFK